LRNHEAARLYGLVTEFEFFRVLIHRTHYPTKDAAIMLITFTCKSAADVLMYETHAKPLLDLLDKEVQRGVITAEEVPEAIARIERAITENKRAQSAMDDHADEASGDPTGDAGVSFSARAFPLLEMLRAAQRDRQFVMWGV
jgi:hypothetical protein